MAFTGHPPFFYEANKNNLSIFCSLNEFAYLFFYSLRHQILELIAFALFLAMLQLFKCYYLIYISLEDFE